jgi:hypothetical protein
VSLTNGRASYSGGLVENTVNLKSNINL